MTRTTSPGAGHPLTAGLAACLLCAGLFSCATDPLAYASLADRDIRIPVDLMGIIDDLSTEPEHGAFLDSIGVSWVRADFRWEHIQPKPDYWNYSRYDNYLELSARRGRKVLGILAFGTPWIFPEGRQRSCVPRDKLPEFLEYVRTVVARYRGKIGAWEIWNEPNDNALAHFWEGSRQDFYELTKQTIRTIREIDPEVKVIVGSSYLFPTEWFEEMERYGALAGASGFSFHPYWLGDAGSLSMVNDAVDFGRRAGVPGEKWVTEIGYPTGGLYLTAASPEEQASRLLKFYAMGAAKGLSKIFWYRSTDGRLRSQLGNIFDSESSFGMAYADFEEKPSASAYRTLSWILPGSEFKPSLLDWRGTAAGDGLVCLPFRRNGELFLFLWTVGGKSGTVSLRWASGDYTLCATGGRETESVAGRDGLFSCRVDDQVRIVRFAVHGDSALRLDSD